jgi:Divergent InlB B-repeat domain
MNAPRPASGGVALSVLYALLVACALANCSPSSPGVSGGQGDACVQQCGTRVCGLDPACGESCGGCGAGETCNTDGQCVLSAGTHNLSVQIEGTGTGTVSGGGIQCPGTCSEAIAAGTQVLLTATAGASSTFGGWSGCDSTRGSVCAVTMSSDDKMVTATFAPAAPSTHTLTVEIQGSGSGTVSGGGISCPGTCQESVASGTQVTLTPSPASGSIFMGWTGCDASSGTIGESYYQPCTVTLNADKTVSATFSPAPPNTYALTVQIAGSGSGTVTGGSINCPGTCSESDLQRLDRLRLVRGSELQRHDGQRPHRHSLVRD